MNAMEVDDDQNLYEGPLVIHFHPGKLTDLAAVSFAADLLRYKLAYMRRNDGKGFDIHVLDLAQVSVPNGIRENFHRLVDDMRKSWTAWWFHHVKRVFFEHSPSPDDMIDWIDQLTWSDDGTINYEKTAKTMLNCDKIPNKLKYQLACSYCFTDDVDRLRTLAQDSIAEEIEKFPRLYDGFFNYWTGKFFGDRVENPRQLFDRLFYSVHYFDSYVHFKPYDEWPAIEYCFDHIANTDRLDIVKAIIVRICRPRLTLYILTKLTCSELYEVIKKFSLDIMEALVKKRGYVEYTKLIWKRMVRIIDDRPVAKIIRHVNNLKFERSYINLLLWDIWRNMSERQKKYIINENICDFTEKKFDQTYNSYFTPNYTLILDFLSHCDLERRYEYWSKNCTYFVVGQLTSENRSIIGRIMKLCIVDDQKIEGFKKTIMIDYHLMRYYCEWLIFVGRIKEIQTYLEFCTSDSQLIRDVKKKIMIEIPKEVIFGFIFRKSNDEMIRDFNLYLEDIFTENESKEFLNEMITHPGNLEEMFKALKTPNRLQKVREMVDKYASSEGNLKVKLYLFEKCRLAVTIKKSVFLDLMEWCLKADKSEVEKFKDMSESPDDESVTEIADSGHSIYTIFFEHYRSRK